MKFKDVPEWAKKMAVEEANADTPDHYDMNDFSLPSLKALAIRIAKTEKGPVDPDVESVKRIIRHWDGFFSDNELFKDRSFQLECAVKVYKEEKAK